MKKGSQQILALCVGFNLLLFFTVITTTAYHYESPVHEVFSWAIFSALNFILGIVYYHGVADEKFEEIRQEIYRLIPKINQDKQELLNKLLWRPEAYLSSKKHKTGE